MHGEMKEEVVKIHSFDGQSIWLDRNTLVYEVGNFLGGGAAGTVYECEHVKTKEHFALKILNPVGYKLIPPSMLKRCVIIVKGKVTMENVEKGKEPMTSHHIWWLMNESSKQYIAAYYSQRSNSLQELSLLQCFQLYKSNPDQVDDDESGNNDATQDIVHPSTGYKLSIPIIPPKYAEFVRKRRRIFTEIKNMRKISNHINVIRLENVLELIQDSKCTIFLVMELANGGELFDRIKIDCGTRESTAKIFFQQLLLGVKHCHTQGVCHRDLKPEVCITVSVCFLLIIIPFYNVTEMEIIYILL
jgi:serine/threonine protein kinase